jgi:DNA-binding NtrC family response regulator
MTIKNKILLVDDDPAWLEELVPPLSKAGYDVDTVSSFEAASEKLLDSTYPVIILDLELEGSPQQLEGLGLLDGLKFLETIPRRQGKAIVLSAYKNIENMRQAFKRGAYDFIAKQDLSVKDFLDIVEEAAKRWRPHQHQRELTPEQKQEYKRVTRKFLRGEPVRFDVPSEASNPWSYEE